MSAEPEELDELEPDDPDSDEREPQAPDGGETFMLTFAAIGMLSLLDVEPASASLPSAPQRTIGKTQGPLRAAPPPAVLDLALDPPAANDAAYLAAIAALDPHAGDEAALANLAPSDGANEELAAPSWLPLRDDVFGDDAIGSSSPPAGSAAMGSPASAVRGGDVAPTLGAGAKFVAAGDSHLALASADDAIDAFPGPSVAFTGAALLPSAHDNPPPTGGGDAIAALSQANVYGGGLPIYVDSASANGNSIDAGSGGDFAARHYAHHHRPWG